jgi:hypothetical protein
MSVFEGPVPKDMFEWMKASLSPLGTADLVRLHIKGNSLYMNTKFVHDCIDDMQKIIMRKHLGDDCTSLEKLAIMVLADSSYLDSGPFGKKHDPTRTDQNVR